MSADETTPSTTDRKVGLVLNQDDAIPGEFVLEGGERLTQVFNFNDEACFLPQFAYRGLCQAFTRFGAALPTVNQKGAVGLAGSHPWRRRTRP